MKKGLQSSNKSLSNTNKFYIKMNRKTTTITIGKRVKYS